MRTSRNKSNGKQWERVHGPDLDPNNEVRAKENQNIMSSEVFKKACEKVGLSITKRQAQKWKNKKGRVFKERNL